MNLRRNGSLHVADPGHCQLCRMDFLSLPHHPNGFDDPSDHWDRRMVSLDERAALAAAAFVMFIPLIAGGFFLLGAVLWWIWLIATDILAVTTALAGWLSEVMGQLSV
jgi:hypothetical protein